MGMSLVSHRGSMDFFVAKGQVIFFNKKKEIILVHTSLYSILVNSLFEAVAATHMERIYLGFTYANILFETDSIFNI